VLVVDVPLLPAKYFRQFPWRDMPVKNKTPIKEGVKAEEILDRMLEGEMKKTSKELWAVAPKLRAALKETLTSKHLNKDESRENKDQEKEDSQPQKRVVLVNIIAVTREPKTYQEAIQLPYSKQWEQAVKFEYAQLQKLGIFEVVNGLPNGRKAIGSCIVFHEKRDGHGNLVKFKACIVAKGFSQIPGEDFTDTFSSVTKFSTLWIFLSYIAYLD